MKCSLPDTTQIKRLKSTKQSRTQNPTLPSTLEKFVNGTLDGERDSALIVNGRVKWQKALFDGLHDTRAKAWQRTARKRDADRAKEMAGEWILAEPPWWTNFQRPCWQVAMRLRYGLEVNPAIGPNIAPYCLARKMNGTYCLAHLDACGQHAQICKVEGANIHRHDTVRDGIVPELKKHVTSVKKEQFIYELSQLNEDTGATSEARMDIIAEMPQLRAMLDVRVFLSTLASQWKSTRAHEAEKHNRYVTHQDGRRCTNMKLYAAVVNTYGKVGKEFEDFASVVDSKNRGKARGRDLTNLLSLLGVYANAEKVVLTHAPALKRAQRGDVVAAIAAKDAQAAATAAQGANAAHLRDNATQKKHPKASKCPELRGDISYTDGQKLVYCKGCKQNYSYAGWADHCAKHHPQHSKVNGEAHADDGDKDDDGVARSKLQSKAKAAAKKKPQPKAKAATKKTGCLKKGS